MISSEYCNMQLYMQRSRKRPTEPPGKPKPNLLIWSKNFTKGSRRSRLEPGCSAAHMTRRTTDTNMPRAHRQAIMLPCSTTPRLSSPSGSSCVRPVLLLETHTKVEHGTPANARAPARQRSTYCRNIRNPILGYYEE